MTELERIYTLNFDIFPEKERENIMLSRRSLEFHLRRKRDFIKIHNEFTRFENKILTRLDISSDPDRNRQRWLKNFS
jgi:hypothetical protein